MIITEPRIVFTDDCYNGKYQQFYCENWITTIVEEWVITMSNNAGKTTTDDSMSRRSIEGKLIAKSESGDTLAIFPFRHIKAFLKCNRPEDRSGVVFLD